MPSAADFVPAFGAAVHDAAGRLAGKASTVPQAQQAAYQEALYGLLVATEWSVGDAFQRQQGATGPVRDFASRFVRNLVLTNVVGRRLGQQFSVDTPDGSNALAGYRNIVSQREQEYRQQLQAPGVTFSQALARRVLASVGLNPNDPGAVAAASADVDAEINALRLPEAATFLTSA